jgi:hypothetical protein
MNDVALSPNGCCHSVKRGGIISRGSSPGGGGDVGEELGWAWHSVPGSLRLGVPPPPREHSLAMPTGKELITVHRVHAQMPALYPYDSQGQNICSLSVLPEQWGRLLPVGQLRLLGGKLN